MKPESLKALGAIPVSDDIAQTLGLTDPPEHVRGPSQSRLENYRREIPDLVGKMAQIVVDNPGQIALVMAGSMVGARVALNLMKPRTIGELLALMIVLQVALPKLAWTAVEKGWITFRVRDADGNLVPLIPGELAA